MGRQGGDRWSVRGECAGLHTQKFAVYDVIQRGPQAAMIVIFNRDEAERLQYSVIHLPRRAENFGHAMHRPRLRLKSNFDEVALR